MLQLVPTLFILSNLMSDPSGYVRSYQEEIQIVRDGVLAEEYIQEIDTVNLDGALEEDRNSMLLLEIARVEVAPLLEPVNNSELEKDIKNEQEEVINEDAELLVEEPVVSKEEKKADENRSKISIVENNISPVVPTKPVIENIPVAPTTYTAPKIAVPVSAGFELHIPKIDLTSVNVIITDIFDPETLKNDLLNGVGAHSKLSRPDENGKILIDGHSSWWWPTKYGSIFKRLPNLKEGDFVYLDYQGDRYAYRVVKTEVVGDNTPSIYTNYNRKELVLFTCYPIGTWKNRFVVYADPVYLER